MNAGWIYGILGAVIGLAGGIIGTYFSIKNTNGPRERAFMAKLSVVAWIAVTGFLVLMFVLPNPYRHLLWIPYAFLLPAGIIWGNRKQQAIRNEEARTRKVQAAG